MTKLSVIEIGGRKTTIFFKENNGYCAKFILKQNKSKLVGELHIPVGEWFGEWYDFDNGFFTETELYKKVNYGESYTDVIANRIAAILNHNHNEYLTGYKLPTGITAYEFLINN